MPETVKIAEPKVEPKVERTQSDDRTAEARPHPSDLHAQLLYRQKTIGNQAVQKLIKSGSLHGPLAVKSQARRLERTKDQDQSKSASRIHGQSIAGASDTGLHIATPPARISPVIIPPRSGISLNSQRSPINTKHDIRHNGSALKIQRHWYNIDIPFTNYQFDPSLEGIKTAAGVVKDTAVAGFEWVVDEIKSLVSSGIDWLKDKWNDIEEFASSALNSATKAFTGIIGFLTSPLSTIADAIMGFDAQSIAKAWATFSGIVNTVANGFKAMTDGVLQQVNNLWGGINGFATSLLDKVSGLTQNFIFRKLPDALQRIGIAVVDKLKSLWATINDGWNKLFSKVKSWIDDAIDKVFSFVKRILSFGINVVIAGIVQFGQLVLFLKDLFSNPQKYIEILAQKSVAAFDGVESKFAGVIGKYFGGTKQAPAAASAQTIHRQPAAAAAPEAKSSASWGDIGNGVLEMMGKKWNEFKSNPLSIVKGLLMDLVFPIVGNIKDVIQLFQDIKKIVTGPLSAGSLEELWTSILQILDIPILISKTIISILMRSLMVPLIVATFIPHPLVKAIAAAVGESLLAAFVSTELTDIEHKVLLLKTGVTTKNQKADAYNRVADSLIALAMTAIIIIVMLILHFIANVMKGIYNFIKGKVFSVERPTISVEDRPAEGKGKGSPEDAKAADPKGKGLPSEDGKRSLRMNEEGKCEVCASPCEDILRKYDAEITKEQKAKIKAIEDDASLSDAEKEEKLKPIEQELAEVRQKARAAETPEQKAKALKDVQTKAKSAIEKIREELGKRENAEKWEKNRAKKAELDAKLRELDDAYKKTVADSSGIESDPGLTDLARDEFDELSAKAEKLNQEVNDILSPPEATVPRPDLPYPTNMLPTDGPRPYQSPDPSGNPVKNPEGGGTGGYLDKDGNIWQVDRTKAKQGKFFEWDVQHRDGSHTNVGSDGNITHGPDNF